MATFPSLAPRTRSLTLGDIPQQVYTGSSGGDVRFKQGSAFIAQQLTLGYEYLTESEAQQILDHYANQQGTLIPFNLSVDVWGGYSTPPVSSASYQWRYAASPNVEVASPKHYNLTIEMETVLI